MTAKLLGSSTSATLTVLASTAVLACLINFVWVAGLRTAEESAAGTQQLAGIPSSLAPPGGRGMRLEGVPISEPVALKDLPRGAQGWVVPWVVRFDSKGLAYLGNTVAQPHTGGTLSLAVNRTDDGALHARLYDLYQFESTSTDSSRLGEPVEVTVLPCQAYRAASDGLIADDCRSVAAAEYVTSQKVPAYARELTVGELPAGMSGWTVPWSLAQTPDGKYMVDRGFMIKRIGGGTLELRVERDANGWLHAQCAPGASARPELRADTRAAGFEPIDLKCPPSHYRPR